MAPPQPSRSPTRQATRGRGRGQQPRRRWWSGRLLITSLTLVLVAALVPRALANPDGELMSLPADTPAAPQAAGENGAGTTRAQAAQDQSADDTQTRDPAAVAGGDDLQPAQTPVAAAGRPLDQQPADAATDATEGAHALRPRMQSSPDQLGQAQRGGDSGACADGGCSTQTAFPGDLTAAVGGPSGSGQAGGAGSSRQPWLDIYSRILREEEHRQRRDPWDEDPTLDRVERGEELYPGDPWDEDESVVNKIAKIQALRRAAQTPPELKDVLRAIEGVAPEVFEGTREYRQLAREKQRVQDRLKPFDTGDEGQQGQSQRSNVQAQPPVQQPEPKVRLPVALPVLPGLIPPSPPDTSALVTPANPPELPDQTELIPPAEQLPTQTVFIPPTVEQRPLASRQEETQPTSDTWERIIQAGRTTTRYLTWGTLGAGIVYTLWLLHGATVGLAGALLPPELRDNNPLAPPRPTQG